MKLIKKIGLPVLPLLGFTSIWMLLVWFEAQKGVKLDFVDSTLSVIVLLSSLFAICLVLARKSFHPLGVKDEILVGLTTATGVAIWLGLSLFVVLNFHLSLGGAL